jgi:hypothetical protein
VKKVKKVAKKAADDGTEGIQPTPEQLVKGTKVYAVRDGEYVPAMVQGPSKNKGGQFALKFEGDGKLLTKPLDSMKLSSGKDADGKDIVPKAKKTKKKAAKKKATPTV